MAQSNRTTSPSDVPSCRMDGRVIRGIGIQKFLDTCTSMDTANIDIYASTKQLEHQWHRCNMGCHEPAYRVIRGSDETVTGMMNTLQKLDPTHGLITGTVNGAVSTTSKIGNGIVRTGQGLGISGAGRQTDIAYENELAFGLLRDALMKALTLSLSVVENPLTATIIRTVSHYINNIPEEITIRLAVSGKFKFGEVDIEMVVKATQSGLTGISPTDLSISAIKALVNYLQNHPEMINNQVGKQLGNRLASHIAAIIAVEIAKRIANMLAKGVRFINMKRMLLKPGEGNPKGLLVGILIGLLKAQGTLQEASNASLRLKGKCPKLWRKLRHEHGIDLLYFFIEDYVREYVDRASLAEKDPVRFIEMVMAILTPPGTAQDLFLPNLRKGL